MKLALALLVIGLAAFGIHELATIPDHPQEHVGRLENALSIGAAVEVAPNLLLTAAHVAAGQGLKHPTLDIALVAMPLPGVRSFAILSARLPKEGERLRVIGFGGGQQTRWTSEGMQSSVKGECSCDAWFGDSGGAVVDERGYVVGILSGIYQDHGVTIPHHVVYVPIADAVTWLRANGVSVLD